MSKKEQAHLTIESHPDQWKNILEGIAGFAQVFVSVEPFVIQLVDVIEGKTATITLNPPKVQ